MVGIHTEQPVMAPECLQYPRFAPAGQFLLGGAGRRGEEHVAADRQDAWRTGISRRACHTPRRKSVPLTSGASSGPRDGSSAKASRGSNRCRSSSPSPRTSCAPGKRRCRSSIGSSSASPIRIDTGPLPLAATRIRPREESPGRWRISSTARPASSDGSPFCGEAMSSPHTFSEDARWGRDSPGLIPPGRARTRGSRSPCPRRCS
jgi:hypothetical protein